MTTTQTILDRYTVWGHLDNFDPGREHFRGRVTVIESKVDPTEEIYVLEVNEAFMSRIMVGPTPIFLLDTGYRVLPLYVSGWPAAMNSVWLQPFPTNPDKKTRPDGRVIDYKTWALGPRTAYHLKVHE